MKDWWARSASRFVPYVNISAQLPDKPDQELFGKLGLRGYPTVLLIDHDGEVLHGRKDLFRPVSERALDEALAHVAALYAARATAAKDPGDRLAAARLALIEGLAKPARGDLEEMGRAAEMPGVDPELVERFEAFRHRKPFLDVFEHYRERYHSAADAEGRVRARRDALEATHRLHKEGLVIADAKDELCHPFWILAFDGAVAAGDRAAAKDALGHYERAFTESTEQIGKMTEKLAEMGS